MPRALLVFLGVAVLGNALYHLAQRSIAPGANPMLALMGAYGVAFAASAAAAPFFGAGSGPWTAQVFAGPVALLGVGVFLIEIGFLLAYRTGAGVQWSGVAVSAAAAVVLTCVAIARLHESFSPARATGMALCLAGLFLISR